MTDHYFSASPDSRHDRREIVFEFEDRSFIFATDSQVFSKAHIDDGSQYLLRQVIASERLLLNHQQASAANNRLFKGLDLGTGYGPLGIILAAVLDVDMVLSDVNERALELAKQNAERNGLKSQTYVTQSDGFESITESFDFIATNPPIRTGKQAIYKMWDEAVEHLKSNGRLYVVIRKQQGAESAIKKLRTLSDMVEVLSKNKGYWVIRLIKEQTSGED